MYTNITISMEYILTASIIFMDLPNSATMFYSFLS
jgi:hypothetical protein